MATLQSMTIAFPPRLMSTSRTPATMSPDFAREIRNMYTAQDGAGLKRNGLSKVGNAIGSGSIVQLLDYVPVGAAMQLLAITDDGKIHRHDDPSWTQIYSGLDTDAHVRSTHFAARLVLCNGVDPLLSWDGTTMRVVEEYVTDAGANLTYISGTQFSIDSDAALYSVGTQVRADLGGGTLVTSTVSAVSGSGTITVTLADSVLTGGLTTVEYMAQPPRFNAVYAAHDRLWGFGTGAISANLSTDVDRLRVYYTHGVNDETAWRNDDGLLQSLNLSDKLPAQDELVAMAVKDGLTVFFGRFHTQIWQGSNPTLTGDFTWTKTIPLGAVHGDLVVTMPNDVGFFTRFGARTLSRTLQTEQLDVGDLGSEVDPTISTAVQTLLSSDDSYRKARAFQYDKQGWFGFKPAGESLVFQANGNTVGWAVFDGLFADASAFTTAPNGTLYIAVGDQLYQYDESSYADDGESITTRWWMPWLRFGKTFKRWANRQVQILADQGAPVAVVLKRFKNYNSSTAIANSATLTQASDYWDGSDWDSGLFDNAYPEPPMVQDKFVADVFSYALETTSTEGPVQLFGLRLDGVGER